MSIESVNAIQPSHPVFPFSSGLQSFPASGSFPMSQFFESGGQRIGVSASTSVLPMNTQDWSPLGWTGWISLQSKGRIVWELLWYYCSTVFRSVSHLPGRYGIWLYHDSASLLSCCSFFFVFGHEVSFFWRVPASSCRWLFNNLL